MSIEQNLKYIRGDIPVELYLQVLEDWARNGRESDHWTTIETTAPDGSSEKMDFNIYRDRNTWEIHAYSVFETPESDAQASIGEARFPNSAHDLPARENAASVGELTSNPPHESSLLTHEEHATALKEARESAGERPESIEAGLSVIRGHIPTTEYLAVLEDWDRNGRQDDDWIERFIKRDNKSLLVDFNVCVDRYEADGMYSWLVSAYPVSTEGRYNETLTNRSLGSAIFDDALSDRPIYRADEREDALLVELEAKSTLAGMARAASGLADDRLDIDLLTDALKGSVSVDWNTVRAQYFMLKRQKETKNA